MKVWHMMLFFHKHMHWRPYYFYLNMAAYHVALYFRNLKNFDLASDKKLARTKRRVKNNGVEFLPLVTKRNLNFFKKKTYFDFQQIILTKALFLNSSQILET